MDLRLPTGDIIPYDGRDDAVFNWDGKVLFTHEFLQHFLHHSCHGRLTLSGYWKAQRAHWSKYCKVDASDKNFASVGRRAFRDLIWQSSMQHIFLDAVFDYLGLLELDYDDAFSCQCHKLYDNISNKYRERVFVIYDNACKLLQAILLRLPSIAHHYEFIIDAFHHDGHSNCSDFYNHKRTVAMQYINAALNEQKNRLLRYMETSVAFMSQIRAMVYMR